MELLVFLQGFFFGVSVFSIFEVAAGLTLLFLFAKKTPLEPPENALKRKEKQNLIPYFGTIGSRKEQKTYEKTESCKWLNKLLSGLYFEHLGYEKIRENLLRRILEDFHSVQGEYASVLERLEVDRFTLGRTFPTIRNVWVKSFGDLAENQFVIFDVFFRGEAAMAVHLASFGKSVKVESDLTEFEGKLVLEAVKWPAPYVQAFFYARPHMKFELRFPEQKFEWLAQLLSTQLTRFLIKQAVHPNAMVHHFSHEGEEWANAIEQRKLPLGDVLNQTGLLNVILHGTEGLPEDANYFLTAEVAHQVFRTQIPTKKTKDPIWEEIVTFDLRKIDVKDETLKLTLRKAHSKTWSRVVTLPLHSVISPTVVTEGFLLSANDDGTADGGTLKISYCFTDASKAVFLSRITTSPSSEESESPLAESQKEEEREDASREKGKNSEVHKGGEEHQVMKEAFSSMAQWVDKMKKKLSHRDKSDDEALELK